MSTLRSRLLRIHAGWVHAMNLEPDVVPAASGSSFSAGDKIAGTGEPLVAPIPQSVALDPIGGQAVVEGVLMRAPGRIAIAARAPDGSIAVQARDFVPFSKRRPWLGRPVLRGAASLVEALYIGTQALNWSASVQEQKPEGLPSEEELKAPTTMAQKAALVFTLFVSFALAMSLFQLLPYFIASLVAGGTRDNPANPLLFNGTAGAVRITLLVVYMWGLSHLRDVRRLFQYHGAEHKTIFAHESGAGLEPGAVARQTRFHPRCGTSFILIVALVCILFFSLLDAFILNAFGYAYPNFLVRFAVHLPFIPLVAGLSFELLKYSAKHQDSRLVRALTLPGLWLQRITTRDPDESQVEVAIASAKAALT
jgi:uncharacterized protein YqhQ